MISDTRMPDTFYEKTVLKKLTKDRKMYKDIVMNIGGISAGKSDFLKRNPVRYLVSAILAGAFVGLGILLIFSIGAPFAAVSSPAVKILMGVSFGIALTLVIMAGGELFTGLNMIGIIGILTRRITSKELIVLWVLSYIGNLLGSLIISFSAVQAGMMNNALFSKMITEITSTKMHASLSELFFKGILCNILVCLAVWMSVKLKEETAKMIGIFWCLFAFISSGYEHSIANMTLMAVPLWVDHGPLVSWAGYIRNIGIVTLGNVVGGVAIGLAYSFISLTPEKK